MAVSFSNQSILTPPRFSASCTSRKFSKTQLLSQSLRFTLCTFSPSISHNCIQRPSFKAFLAAPDSAPTTNDIEENHENDLKASKTKTDQKHVTSLKNLIRIYKEAILHGDKKTIFDIEAKINVIEHENHELVKKVSALSAEVTAGKEKYIRLQADFDNFRKRSEKERHSIRSDAQGEVIESLLPMVDSFERAKQHIKPETEKEKNINSSYQGIYKQFVEIMRSLQVAIVGTVGKPFDPSLHEAIAREESHKYKEGIIIQEFRRGFLLGDRLLRPAMVKVSAGPGIKKATADAEKHAEQPTTGVGVDER